MTVNWWLVVVAFVLGFALTLAFTIRRVTREVPVHAGASAATLTGAAGAAGAAKAPTPHADLDAPTSVIKTVDPDVDEPTSVIRADVERPYGAGSVRGAEPPSGWNVKGNEDSMLYHTLDSPYYERTIAEVWFRDVATAEAAGFTRWDSGKSQRGSK